MSIWTPPPLRQRLLRPGAGTRNSQRGWVMAPYRYAAGGGDPYFANVVLLVDASARADASTPSDIDVIGKTPTWRNNAQCKTDQFKFGSSSIYLDGTNDRLCFPDSADFDFGSGDFTVECWFRHEGAYSTNRLMVSHANSYGSLYSVQMAYIGSSNLLYAVSDGTTAHSGNSSASSAPTDTWLHCAVSRVGSNFYGLCNGGVTTFYSSAITLMNATGAFTIGGYVDADSALHWKGWIDQIRVTKGVGRYSGAYSVPTAPFPHS